MFLITAGIPIIALIRQFTNFSACFKRTAVLAETLKSVFLFRMKTCDRLKSEQTCDHPATLADQEKFKTVFFAPRQFFSSFHFDKLSK